jgi:hypothetical protein
MLKQRPLAYVVVVSVKTQCHAADRHRWKIQFDDLVQGDQLVLSQSGLQGCVVSGNNEAGQLLDLG